MPLDTDEDHGYSKRPYSFPPKDLKSDDTMDKDLQILDGEKASFKKLLERAQQAQHQRRQTSGLLIDVITQDKDLLVHLEDIITGKVASSWAKKEERVIIFFEDDDQLDNVLHFLSKVLEETQTGRFSDQVAFAMDLLLPEATVHALATVHSVSLDKAKELYKCGPEYDWSEKQLDTHYLCKHLSQEAKE